jgi:predicted dehydrogenase
VLDDTRIRVGIAGAGMVARIHADAARRAGSRIVGISASSPERGVQAAAELGAERAFPTSQDLVTSEDVDVVHICTPNDSHVPLARAALLAGKHVICEKPLATSSAEARELTALAERLGLVAAVPFVYRYHPMAAEARARMDSVGELRLIHGHYLQDWLSQASDNNWRVDAAVGGPSRAFADIGSHWCDLVEWVTGHRIAELTALTATVHDKRSAGGAKTFTVQQGEAADPTEAVSTEDAAHVMFRTDRGATGTLVVSQVSPGRKNRLWFEVDGAQASVSFDQENPETLLFGRRASTEILVRDASVLSPDAARLSAVPAGHPMGYRDCFAAFVADVHATVRGEDTPAFPTFADAARTATITDAVLSSARTRSWIEVSRP